MNVTTGKRSNVRFKCHSECKLILNEEDLDDGKCPQCGGDVLPMCERDHCHCTHYMVESIAYCPLCGEPMCPKCGSHDVAQISRVTGYLQEVGGWNMGKQQELKDRKRHDVA